MGEYKIAVLPGDGIGPEVVAEAVKVLKAVGLRFGHSFDLRYADFGGAAIDSSGSPFPPETERVCMESDAVLFGAVGGPKWDSLDPAIRPEKGLLALRKAAGAFANLRPAKLFPELADACYLRPDIVANGIDILVVRELIGDVYFGEPSGIEVRDGERVGFSNMIYREHEIRRVAKVAFETAMKRSKRLCSVDKANVLAVSRLWREVVTEVSREYPEVELSFMYVDNAAMQLVRNPAAFDVIVTGNLFGDILSDEAAAITGSIGMLPSASVGGPDTPGLYEPVHGSAPDIAGQNLANPVATILSMAMLLRYSLSLGAEADAVEAAVASVLADGFRTGDIFREGMRKVGCSEMGQLIADRV
ncbi:MAG TPA: 3-isopropylmalate dehydrogenase [Methanocorpusculum sp.]|nr:3-isopropylmalate dehydrogenase [Methanocorpusculum sp.]HJK43800.1 3-isopropylmalate dehydrogenase [Methanocorpusculum sp.]